MVCQVRFSDKYYFSLNDINILIYKDKMLILFSPIKVNYNVKSAINLTFFVKPHVEKVTNNSKDNDYSFVNNNLHCQVNIYINFN